MIDVNELKSSTKYCHYTDKDSAEKILSNNTFLLSKFSSMNDKSESGEHAEEDKLVYSLSFCHSESKSVPLFYLYSGIDGKGCRIQFTDTRLKTILDKDKIEIWSTNKNNTLKKKLPSSDYDVYFDWIHYVSLSDKEKPTMWSTYKVRKKVITKEEFDNLKNSSSKYFIKDYIWRYEKEFRVIVKLKSSIGSEKLAIKLSNSHSGISIYCAPEVLDKELEIYKSTFSKYKIKNIYQFTNQKIEMNLIDKNNKILKRSKNEKI